MAGSDWSWQICWWYVYGERLRDIPRSHESMSGGSSTSEIKSRRVHPTVLAVDAMKNRKYTRHGGSGYEAGGDSSAAFLLHNLFLHQPNVSFLLLKGAVLGSQRGLEDMM